MFRLIQIAGQSCAGPSSPGLLGPGLQCLALHTPPVPMPATDFGFPGDFANAKPHMSPGTLGSVRGRGLPLQLRPRSPPPVRHLQEPRRQQSCVSRRFPLTDCGLGLWGVFVTCQVTAGTLC